MVIEMEERMLDDLLDETSDEYLCSMSCGDLQNIVNFCKENYDSWRDIKLNYVMSFSSEKKLTLEVNDFELDRVNRNLILKSKDDIFKVINLSQIDRYLDFLRFDIDNWWDIRICCDNYCYVNNNKIDESNDTVYFLS